MKHIKNIIEKRIAAIEDTLATLRRNNCDDSPAFELLGEEIEEWKTILNYVMTGEDCKHLRKNGNHCMDCGKQIN